MTADNIRVSIVVPAYNAGSYLSSSLEVIWHGWFEGCELIVVDDGSEDRTAHIVSDTWSRLHAEYRPEAHRPLHLVRHETCLGASAARTTGVASSRGDILVFIDADVMVNPDTIRLLYETLDENPDVSAVFGSYDDNPLDWHCVSAFKNLMHHHVHQQGAREAGTFWTGCGALRRQVFDRVGPFNSPHLEDIDYGHRLREAGQRIWLRPDIQCKHMKRWTLLNLIKTDVLRRGVPWTVMMLKRKRFDGDLNLGSRHRWSALLSFLAVAILIIGAIAAAMKGSWNLLIVSTLAAVVCTVLVILLQRQFFNLLMRRGGICFTGKCVPLMILYYNYSLVSVALGILVFLKDFQRGIE